MGRSQSNARECDIVTKLSGEADPRFLTLPKYKQQQWVQMMLSTIFRHTTYKQLQVQARSAFGSLDYKAMWKAITDSGYVVKEVKCWLFWCVKRGLRGVTAAKVAPAFNVREADTCLRLLMSPALLTALKKTALRYPALTLSCFDRHIVTIHQRMRDWLGKFVHRKMRFVYQQQGLQAHDMAMQVFAKGVHALYLTYPKVESLLHATNIVKSAAHNFGINLIIQQTHEKRARVVREGDTFTNKVVAIHDLTETHELHAPDERENRDRVIDIGRAFNLFPKGTAHVDHRVLFPPMGTPVPPELRLSKKQRLIALFMGYEDKEFNQWLSTTHGIRSSSSEYLERAANQRFMKLALEYLGLRDTTGRAVLERLRRHLSAYSNGSPTEPPTTG